MPVPQLLGEPFERGERVLDEQSVLGCQPASARLSASVRSRRIRSANRLPAAVALTQAARRSRWSLTRSIRLLSTRSEITRESMSDSGSRSQRAQRGDRPVAHHREQNGDPRRRQAPPQNRLRWCAAGVRAARWRRVVARRYRRREWEVRREARMSRWLLAGKHYFSTHSGDRDGGRSIAARRFLCLETASGMPGTRSFGTMAT